MKRIKVLLLSFVVVIFCISCQKVEKEYQPGNKRHGQKRDEGNAMQVDPVATDGSMVYVQLSSLVYRIDVKNKIAEINCGDMLCDHQGTSCSARLPKEESGYRLVRNGDRVYALGNKIFQIGKNSKKEIGRGHYGHYGNKIFFDNYIAYFKEEDTIVVENIENGQEVQKFENVTGYTQGNFYYEDCLYLITAEQQLIRLNLETGEKEILEKKGATRASLYDGFVYYVKVSENMENNYLVKMSPDTLKKETVTQGVFYYNMLGDKLYYSTYPERKLYVSQLDGKNPVDISSPNEFDMGCIYTFSELGAVLIAGRDVYDYRVLDENNKVDYENEIILTQ